MASYTRPLVTPVSLDAASLSCNITGRNSSGQCVEFGLTCIQIGGIGLTIDPTQPITVAPILTNTLLGLDESGVRVTPLANTGAPGSDPIEVGIPVGVHGVKVVITPSGGAYAIDPNGLGVDFFHLHVSIP